MSFEQPQREPGSEKINRRKFLKRAAIGAGVAGLAGIGAFRDFHEQSTVEEEKLNEEGVVVRKKHLPSRKGVLPGVSSTVELPEKYEIYINTSRGETRLVVSPKRV